MLVICMNKKYMIVVLLVALVFLVGCENKVDSMIKNTKKDVTNSIKSTSKEKIKESIEYIHDNYEKKINKNFVYHTLLLKKLCDNTYLNDSKVKRLAEASYEYMFRQSKGNKKELEESLDKVYENLDDEVNNFYVLYQRLAVVEGYLTKAKTKLLIEAEEKGFITNSKIDKAIEYIQNYYDNAFKNNEVIERLSYYSMYLEKIGSKVKKDNNIVKLGTAMKKYLQNGEDKKKEEISSLLIDIANNKEALIGELIAG